MKAKSILLLVVVFVFVLALASCEMLPELIPGLLPEQPEQHEHTWVAATCVTPKTCSKCGALDGEALGHTEEIIVGKDATCTENGLTEGKKCSVCSIVIIEQKVISSLGHDIVVDDAVAPSCTEAGISAGEHCSRCDHKIEQETIPALNHKDEDGNYKCDLCQANLCVEHDPAAAVEENIIEATCTAEGSYDSVVKCSKCGYEISRESKTIDKKDHTEEIVTGKTETCTEAGLTDGKKCSVCGETLVAQNEIPSTGHTAAAPVEENRNESTCSAEGSYDSVVYCSVCSAEISRDPKTTDKKDHTEEIVTGKAATCTEVGLTEGKKCSVCGETLVAQEEIAAGHIIVDGSCTRCGYIPNVFAGKQFVASADAAANMYSATYGYQTITDGIIFEEGKGRYSSKQNGGKIEATIDLGAVYELDEFKVYLYWNDGVNRFGSGLTIQVLFAGEWTTVVDCKTVEELQAYWVDNPNNIDKEWLVFDLGGVVAKQVKFTIPGQTSLGWSTFYEMECSAKLSDKVEPEPEEPVFVENIFAGKEFTPTSDALNSALSASWWKGSGYGGLTDGIKNADNAPGRFSTVMKTTGMMDATIDLGGTYELHSLKFYTYDPAAGTGAGSLGSNLLIQVYADGEWKDVVACADNATLASYLVVNEGTYNDYLEFDLEGIKAEKVRFYISASASASGTTYEEIECNGYEK